MTVLVLAPHADDEILGCGGAIAKHVNAGEKVVVAVLTNASVGAPELFSTQLIEKIRLEAREAHRALGVAETIFEELPAPQLDQFPLYKVSGAIAEIFKRVVPDTLYVPFHGDLHRDHGVIFDAAMVVARPMPGQKLRRLLAYETVSETEWCAPTPDRAFVPNYFIDISEHLPKKLNAMRHFESQLKEFPHPRSIQALESLARWRGASVGVAAAEAFWLVREVIK